MDNELVYDFGLRLRRLREARNLADSGMHVAKLTRMDTYYTLCVTSWRTISSPTSSEVRKMVRQKARRLKSRPGLPWSSSTPVTVKRCAACSLASSS